MNNWLLPATTASLLAGLVLLAGFLTAYRRDPDRFTGLWLLGWSIHSLRLLLDVIVASQGPSLLLAIAIQESAGISAIILLLAALRMISRESYLTEAVLGGILLSGLIIVSHLFTDSFLLQTLPCFFFFGVVQIITGVIFYRYYRQSGLSGARLVAVAMILWGIHKFDYPFLRPLAWFAPMGYLFAALFELLTGLGVLILLFERMEGKAKSSEERLRLLFNSGRDAIFVLPLPEDSQGSEAFLEVNDTACNWLGYGRRELLRLSLADIIVAEEEEHRAMTSALARLRQAGQALFELTLIARTGRRLPVEINAHRLLLDRRPAALLMARDLSERCSAEERLRASHQRLLLVLDSLDAMVYVADLATYRILYANQNLKDTLGEVEGKICWQALQEDQTGPCPFCTNHRLLTADGQPAGPYSWEFQNTANGRWYSIHDKAIYWVDGRLVRLEIATDISRRKEAEQRLQRELAVSEALERVASRLLEGSPAISDVAQLVLDQAKQLTGSTLGFAGYIDPQSRKFIIPTLEQILARGECPLADAAQRVISFLPEEDGRYGHLFGHGLNTGQPFYTNSPESHPASRGVPEGHPPITAFLSAPVRLGERLVGEIALANPPAAYSDQDLAIVCRLAELYGLAIHQHQAREEQERLAGELRHAQKMEALGTLAGGIAHDFNNILFAILGYTELALAEAGKDSSLGQLLAEVLKGGRRAADLVRQILAFSRKTEQPARPIQLQFVLKESIKFLRGTLPSTITIDQDIDVDCPPVLADLSQIHQVIINLCTNAYQAIGTEGGTITVSLQPARMAATRHQAGHPELPTGDYVRLAVADTGPGMTEEVRERIFEPYFTTKKQGEGSGLGLAVVHGIINRFHGHILVDSAPGKGSVFTIYLPAAKDTETRQPPPGTATREAPDHLSCQVLFVDDEQSITRLGKELLERLGCRVHAHNDSQAALAEFMSAPDSFDLVITDQTMPGLTGLELARQVLAKRPSLPVVLLTGYSNADNEEQARKIGVWAVMMKPLTAAALARAVEEALDGSAQPSSPSP